MSVNDTVTAGEHAARNSGHRHQGEGHLAVLDREVTMRAEAELVGAVHSLRVMANQRPLARWEGGGAGTAERLAGNSGAS